MYTYIYKKCVSSSRQIDDIACAKQPWPVTSQDEKRGGLGKELTTLSHKNTAKETSTNGTLLNL